MVGAINTDEVDVLARDALARIEKFIVRTPLVRSGYFSAKTGANVFIKYESMQVTGSFKARGAFSKVSTLSDAQREKGVVTASTGNHGAAVTYAINTFGGSAIVFMPTNASSAKVDAIRRLGAEVRFHSDDSGVTEVYAHEYADQNGLVYVSPYNDPAIIAGQATMGIEIGEQLARPDKLYLSVGGGGMLSGVAGYLKPRHSQLEIIGCSPAADHAMYASVKAGRVVSFPAAPTLVDSCAGGMEDDAITLPLVAELVDRWILPDEAAIADAMRSFILHEHQLLEGSSAMAIVGLLEDAEAHPESLRDKNVVIVVCGSRVSERLIRSLFCE